MIYAIIEIIVYLLIAAVLGFLLGWWLRDRRVDSDIDQARRLQKQTDDEQLDVLRHSLEKCEIRCELLEQAGQNDDYDVEPEDLRDDENADEDEDGNGDDSGAEELEIDADNLENEQEQAVKDVRQLAQKLAGAESAADDDLKKIYGIGPKFEELLKGMGITGYQQIAQLKSDDIATIAAALGAFPDRIERDNWSDGAAEAYREKYGKDIT